MDYKEMSLNQMIEKGKSYSDGHFTIMHFTTNYRASFSTPENREDIENMSVGETGIEAVSKAFKKISERNLIDILEEFRNSVVEHFKYMEQELLKRCPAVEENEEGEDVLVYQSVRENCQDFYKEKIWKIDNLIKEYRGIKC